MITFRKSFLSLLAFSLMTAASLHGQDPECSDPLPAHDYSAVGYQNGKVPIPYGKEKATLSFDSGRHIIDKQILLSDGDVLRGAGRDKTILYFPKGLKGFGEPCGHQGVDCYDWANGVIRAEGKSIGIEDLTIEFPPHEWCHYCGEKNEGYNGVAMSGCTDCWVKNVTIRNCDSGLFIEKNSSNNTVEGLHVYVNAGVKSHLHVAISAYSTNNLATDFKIYGSSFHGLTGNWGASNNVFANGWGESIRIEPDHNCNGKGGSSSCCPHMMYSNISGYIESIQTRDRAGNTLQTVLWNVGEKTRCPEDAYWAQVERKRRLSK